MVVHACVMRACVWRCIAVRACACTCGLFARACMCLCVHVPCTGDYRLVSSSTVLAQRAAVRRPGSGHIQQPRLGHIRRTHPTLSRYTQGSHALPRGQRNRTRRQRGSHPIPQPTRGAHNTALRREWFGAVRSAWACLRRIVQPAQIRLRVGAPSFERLRQLKSCTPPSCRPQRAI